MLGGTTTIPAKITTVSLQLLNPNGSVFATVPFAPFEDLLTSRPAIPWKGFPLPRCPSLSVKEMKCMRTTPRPKRCCNGLR
jgi:hypothetical protein